MINWHKIDMAITRKIHKVKTYKKDKRKTIKNKMLVSKQKPDYVEHLSEPWFSLISLGLKTIEGRRNKGRFKDMQVGQVIEWHNDDFLPRRYKTRIIRKTEYQSFKEYLTVEGLNKCLPGIPSLEHGLSVYYKYFTKEDEALYGVIAIEIELI